MKKQAPAKRTSRKRSRGQRFKHVDARPIAVAVVILVMTVGAVALTEFVLQGDFVELDTIEVQGEDLLLGANCLGVIGSISAERGEAIQRGIDQDNTNRPNVYDVFRDVVEQYDIQLESVAVTRIEQNNFLSTMTFTTENKILEADARPSDAIALALRTGSPIYMNRTLLEEFGTNICPEDN